MRDDDTPCMETDFAPVLESREFEIATEQWIAERHNILFGRYHDGKRVAAEDSDLETLITRWKLACEPLICNSNKNAPVYVDNHFGAHPCKAPSWYGATMEKGYLWPCLKSVPALRSVAEDVVRAAGLSPKAATTDDMDQNNARFYCDKCPQKLARTWRNCVSLYCFRWAATFTSVIRLHMGTMFTVTKLRPGLHFPPKILLKLFPLRRKTSMIPLSDSCVRHAKTRFSAQSSSVYTSRLISMWLACCDRKLELMAV